MATIKVSANKIFKPVHQSKARYVALKGSAGSGKSTDTAQQYILRLMADKGRNLLAMRKSEVTNRDSTYSELLGAINRMGVADYWTSTLSPLKLTCINGNQIIFRGMHDDKQREKLKSITFENGDLTDVWLEEATEFTQADVDIIDDRLRGILPEGLFYQIKMTLNPVNRNHWIKRAFFDATSPDILAHHSTYKDNRFIDEAYYRRMERRRELDPDGYVVYGLGEWGETGGLILQNWTIEDVSQDLNDYDAVAIGQDFGFNHANAILLLGFKDGDIYILRELYEYEKDTAELIRLAEPWLPKDVDMFCDSAEPDRIKTWRKAGFRAKAVSKETTKGKKYQATQIDWLKQRRIYVAPTCLHAIEELEQWKFKKSEITGDYLDEPVEFMDDAMAALRYGVEAWRKPRGKAVNAKEQIARLKRLGL